MNTQNNDHEAILAAIANADQKCSRKPVPQPRPQQQAPPLPNQQSSAPDRAQPQQPQQQQVINLPSKNGHQTNERKAPTDQDLAEVFGERKKKQFKLGLMVNLVLLALFVTPCLGFTAWYHASPDNKESVAALMENLSEVPDDVKGIANIKESYDEALGEIGNRGESIDAATLALGVDPSEFQKAASENDDTAFLKEQADSPEPIH